MIAASVLAEPFRCVSGKCTAWPLPMAVLLLSFALRGQSGDLDKNLAKSHYLAAEAYMRDNEVLKARPYYCDASKEDPTNSKYQKKCVETSKSASRIMLDSGRHEESRDPAKAMSFLEEALKYDKSNTDASQAVTDLTKQIDAAKAELEKARVLLDRGELSAAEASLKSLDLYRNALGSYHSVQDYLTTCRAAVEAEHIWSRGDWATAIQTIVSVEHSPYRSSPFIAGACSRLRHEISEDRLRAALALPVTSPLERMNRMKAVDEAARIDQSNAHAGGVRDTERAELVRVISSIPNPAGHLPSSAARVLLERLIGIEGLMGSDPAFVQQRDETRGRAYPFLKVRIAVDDPQGCLPSISATGLKSAIQKALTPYVATVERSFDLEIRLAMPSCNGVDMPRDSVQKANSTYTAATNQMANPAYTTLQNSLAAAEADLNRAAAAYSQNPSVVNAYVLGRARRQVNDLQAALYTTPPYASQDVMQQYQYDKFEAYREYGIAANLQFEAPAVGFVGERKVSALDEGRAPGISGVLAQDHSGVKNIEPALPKVADLAGRALSDFSDKIDIASRELLAEYLGPTILDHDQSPTDRLAFLLDFCAIAKGTKYEYRPDRLALENALIGGSDQLPDFLDSVSLPTPRRDVAGTHRPAPSKKLDLQAAIAGVVGLETDARKSGTGFFATPNCLVVTNAHVVEGAETIVLRDSSNKIYVAQIAERDENRDLALLTSNAKSCTPLTLGNSDDATVGQDVYAIGNPLGLAGTVTRGIVSAVRSTPDTSYIQIDATINPGNSGGPLLNTEGAVIGITTFKVRGFEGLNFAIAVNEIKRAFRRALQ